MKDDQIVRIACGAFSTIAYCMRLYIHGNGPVNVFGYAPNSFVVVLIVLLTLALPETLDMLPVGPTRKA